MRLGASKPMLRLMGGVWDENADETLTYQSREMKPLSSRNTVGVLRLAFTLGYEAPPETSPSEEKM